MIKKLTVLLKDIYQQGYICGMSDDSDFENQANKFLDEVRCKNCRYWGGNEAEWAGMLHKNHAPCTNYKCGWPEPVEMNFDKICESGEPIGFGPDFGCIHFESKGDDK